MNPGYHNVRFRATLPKAGMALRNTLNLSYMKPLDKPLGLLANFHDVKLVPASIA